MSSRKNDFSHMIEGYLPDQDAIVAKDSSVQKVPITRALPIQAQLDLHGQNLEQARKLVDRFLKDSASRGLRKVLIIHGKGSGVLKTGIAQYLEGHLLAGKREYAKQEDGGSGALVIYIKT